MDIFLDFHKPCYTKLLPFAVRAIIAARQRNPLPMRSAPYVDRDTMANILSDTTLIRAIAGPRRAGKSFVAIHRPVSRPSCRLPAHDLPHQHLPLPDGLGKEPVFPDLPVDILR